jgi:iron-sulfur cluster assembly accessory protein
MTAVTPTESVVTFTPSAVAELKAMLASPDNGGKTLRLYVEQGGCSGMQYGMVFDEKRDGDLVAEQDGVQAFVDPISADFLRGTQVDFSDALTGGGFKLKNPNAKQSCGCGKSFQA